MKKLRKLREVAAEQAIRQAPPHPFLAGVSDDEPFWRDLPDILQSQILVMIDNGMPTKKNPKPRPVERILWAGTPHTRKRTILLLVLLWAVTLAVPAILLEDLVDEVGGWLALAWALFTRAAAARCSRSPRSAPLFLGAPCTAASTRRSFTTATLRLRS